MSQAVRDRVDKLERVCAEVYQVLGELGAPARVLDQLWAAAQGDTLPHETVLPFNASECTPVPSVAAAALGRRNKGVSTPKKAKASRLNGQKYGGRPAKFERGARVVGATTAPAHVRGRAGVIVRRGTERASFLVKFDDATKAEPVRTWHLQAQD